MVPKCEMIVHKELFAPRMEPTFLPTVLLIFSFFQGAVGMQIVYPSILEARGEDGHQVISIDESTKLFLKRTSVLAENILVTTSEGGEMRQSVINASEYNERLYHDPENGAAVLLHNTNNGLKLSGLISRDLRIEPLETIPRSPQGLVPHRILPIKRSAFHHLRSNIAERTAQQFGVQPRYPQKIVQKVRPEIYFFSDSEHNKGMQDIQVIAYCSIFTTAVNLFFDELKWPTVQLVIVGLYISKTKKDDDAYVKISGQYLDAEETLRQMSKFKWSKQNTLGKADLNMLLTGRDVAATMGGKMSNFAQGLAYLAAACGAFNVGLAEDYGDSYVGLDRVAHEVGHLFGCVHDGEGPAEDIPGHQGSLHPLCSQSYGYIMSYVDGGPRRYHFSHCCQMQMRLFFSTASQTCLDETHKWVYSNIFVNVLPGIVTSTQRICATRHPKLFNHTYVRDPQLEHTCMIVCKMWNGVTWREVVEKAPDGWMCAAGKRCIKGICDVHRG
ncbi:venom metalloproteinase BumaMPs1-like [Haemaphysalis longicornis]